MKNLTRPTSCAIVPLLMVLLLHTLQAQAQGPCTDVSPPGRYTCEQQKSYGKCDEDWMVRGQFCAKTCQRCAQLFALENCNDVRPPGWFSASCVIRQRNGECPTVTEQGYCLQSCGICGSSQEPATSSPSPSAAAAAATSSPSQTTSILPASPAATSSGQPSTPDNKTSTLQQELTAAAQSLSTSNTSAAEVLPSFTVDQTVPDPSALGNKGASNAPAAPSTPTCKVANVTAWKVLSDDPDLEYTMALAENLMFQDVLSRQDITYTLFAPTNKAWEKTSKTLGAPVSTLITAPSAKDVFLTHIVPNSALKQQDIEQLLSLSSQSGALLYVNIAPDGMISLISMGSTANVTKPDAFIGCKFVIHKIDNVLLPQPTKSGINPDYEKELRG